MSPSRRAKKLLSRRLRRRNPEGPPKSPKMEPQRPFDIRVRQNPQTGDWEVLEKKSTGHPQSPTVETPHAFDSEKEANDYAAKLREEIEKRQPPQGKKYQGTSPGPRWTTDWGAMPGEPVHYLDVRGGRPDTAKAVIVEREVPTKEGFEGLLEGFYRSFEVWTDPDADGPVATFHTQNRAAKFAEGYFPLVHKKMLDYADTVGISQIIKDELKNASGLNIGKTWLDVLQGGGMDIAPMSRPGAMNYAVTQLMDQMPNLSLRNAKALVALMASGEEIIAFDPSEATEHTIAHEISHTLTSKALDFSKEKPKINKVYVKELVDEVSGSIESLKYQAHPEWIEKTWEFTTEVVTHYLMGNLKPGSRLTQLAEAIIRNADDPGIRKLIGKSLSIYFAVKGFQALEHDQD